MNKNFRVAILGGGSFGTAVANMVAEKGHDVYLWLRNESNAADINQRHCNAQYLPGITLHTGIKATTDLAKATEKAELIFIAVPSSAYRQVVLKVQGYVNKDTYIISLTKGIEQKTFALMSQILEDVLPDNAIGVMSGPNFAREIADKQITATVIASRSELLVEAVQAILQSTYFRVYASEDVFGVELGGALKNCYAIMSGMAASLGCGQNTTGFLITRSLAEMSRFAEEMGADPMTFLGLSGVGDLIITCMSPLSRNYQVGFEIGKGRKLPEVCKAIGQVAEGVNTLRLVKYKADELAVYMPLIQGMYGILYENKGIEEVVTGLMAADQAKDVEFTIKTLP